MAYFEWKTGFDLGITKINSEHRQLILLMNVLFDKNAASAPHAELAKALKELVDYTKLHFAEEEAYMDSIEFPEATIHKAIHVQLLQRLTEFGKEFERQGGGLTKQLFDFLSLWLASHIQGIDRKYSDHAAKRQRKAG